MATKKQGSMERVVNLDFSEEAHDDIAKQGIFLLNGEIDDGRTYGFTLDMFQGVAKGLFKDKPLLVILNSPGGNLQHSLAIYDTIRMLVAGGVHVDIFGMGMVASGGAVIMQAGTRRIGSPNAQFLVHEVSQETLGFYSSEKVSESKDKVKEAERLNDIYLGIIATRSDIPVEHLKKLCVKHDHWMDPIAARALGKNGLIDEVAEIPDRMRTLLTGSSA